jgi:small subunit ribosomal protein S8
MSFTDPIADFLTRIRNAIQAGHDSLEMPKSKAKLDLCKILKEEGYIEDFSTLDDRVQGIIHIDLKYVGPSRRSAITGLDRVSTPGRRTYVGADEIPRVLNGLGIAIVSTSKGVMTGIKAKEQNTGGELVCKVW